MQSQKHDLRPKDFLEHLDTQTFSTDPVVVPAIHQGVVPAAEEPALAAEAPADIVQFSTAPFGQGM